MAVALPALGGFALGGVAGFLVALLQLYGKRVRNERLVRNGHPPIRDCVLSKWHIGCALVGAVASGVLSLALPTTHAILYGSLPLPGLLLVVFALAAAYQLIAPAR